MEDIMIIRSKFDKGNIVLVYDVIQKRERFLHILGIEKWDLLNGFSYKVKEYYDRYAMEEMYDDFDFENQFDIETIFCNAEDLKMWQNEGAKCN